MLDKIKQLTMTVFGKGCLVCKYEEADAFAIKALRTGTATPDQQMRALHWIVNSAAKFNDVSWDMENERASSFFAGRRFVGWQISNLAALNIKEKYNAEE